MKPFRPGAKPVFEKLGIAEGAGIWTSVNITWMPPKIPGGTRVGYNRSLVDSKLNTVNGKLGTSL